MSIIMPFEPTIMIAVIAIFFLASLVYSIFGFASALIAMPLLAMVVSLDVSRPLVAMVTTTIGLFMLLRDWRNVNFPNAWRLIVGALIGIPVGFWLFHQVNESVMKIFLGTLVVGFSTYNLVKPDLFKITSNYPALLFGFGAGVMGGAYNTPGPLLVIYGTLRGWAPRVFIATLQSYFITTAPIILAGHCLEGLWTTVVFQYYAASLPAAVIALLLGNWLKRFFHGKKFQRYVFVLLLIIGVSLLVRVVWKLSVA